MIAIHRVVSSADGSDPTGAYLSHLIQQLSQIAITGIWWCIATIGKNMNKDIFNPTRSCQSQKVVKMCIHRMDTAIRNQTHQMECSIFACVNGSNECWVFKKFSAADHFVDSCHFHLDYSAGAQIHVTNLGIAELAGRQSDMLAGAFDQSMFIFLVVSVKKRSMS